MTSPTHTLRVLFALAIFVCAVVSMLFIHGRATPTPQFWMQLLAWSLAITAAVCWFTFRRGRLLLRQVPVVELLRTLGLHLLVAYVASAAAITAASFVLAFVVTRSAVDAAALAVLAGLWLSLWVAPAAAAVSAWKRLSGRQGDEA